LISIDQLRGVHIVVGLSPTTDILIVTKVQHLCLKLMSCLFELVHRIVYILSDCVLLWRVHLVVCWRDHKLLLAHFGFKTWRTPSEMFVREM
jgi:hypothetical protein